MNRFDYATYAVQPACVTVWEVEIEGKIFTLNLLINPIQIFIQIHLFIHYRNFNFWNSLPFTFLTQIKYFTLNTFKILARVAFFHIYKLNFTQHFSNIEYIFLFRISKSFSPFVVVFYYRIKFQTRRKKKSKRTSQRKIQLWLSMCTRCLLTSSTRNSRLCIILARLSTHCTLLVELIRGWEEEGKNIELHTELLNQALCVCI